MSPHLVCRDAAKAIDFYKKAFGAEEMMRLPGQDGKLMHASLRIFESSVMLVDEAPQWGALSPQSLNGSPVTIHIFVENVDKAISRAADAGGKVTMPPADMFWGDRYGVVQDPYGHNWSFATHLKDMTQDEIQEAFKNFKM